MQPKYELLVKNGETNQGKAKWVKVGAAFENDKGMFLILDRHINFAAFPDPDQRGTVMVSMFEPKPKDDLGF